MNERFMDAVRYDRCGESIAKGDSFVVSGKSLCGQKSLFRARLTDAGALPEDFGETYNPACYLESLKEKKRKTKKDDAKP